MSETAKAIVSLTNFLQFLAVPRRAFFFTTFDAEARVVEWLTEYDIAHDVWDFVLTDARQPLDACVVISMGERDGKMFRLAFNADVYGPIQLPTPTP